MWLGLNKNNIANFEIGPVNWCSRDLQKNAWNFLPSQVSTFFSWLVFNIFSLKRPFLLSYFFSLSFFKSEDAFVSKEEEEKKGKEFFGDFLLKRLHGKPLCKIGFIHVWIGRGQGRRKESGKWESVWVFEWIGEKEKESVCEWVRRERDREKVCVRERERNIVWMGACVRERECRGIESWIEGFLSWNKQWERY